MLTYSRMRSYLRFTPPTLEVSSVRPRLIPFQLACPGTSSRSRNVGTGLTVLVALASDRKSTRLNSSHGYISYAVFCLKKKKIYIDKISAPILLRTMSNLSSIFLDSKNEPPVPSSHARSYIRYLLQ